MPFHGWDLVPADLVAGVVDVSGGVHAVLDAGPVLDESHVFDQKRYDTARSLFDAMTMAPEETIEHIVPPGVVWKSVRAYDPANAGGFCPSRCTGKTARSRATCCCARSGSRPTGGFTKVSWVEGAVSGQ